MDKRIIYLAIFILLTSCMPQKPIVAKRKINRMKERIEGIARYHGFDSIWFETKKVQVQLPEINRQIALDFQINRRVKTDSIINIICNDPETPKKETLIQELLSEEINYEDDSLKLHISIKPGGYVIDYTIKSRSDFIDTKVPIMHIDSGLKYYQQKGFWIVVSVLVLLLLFSLYLAIRYKQGNEKS